MATASNRACFLIGAFSTGLGQDHGVLDAANIGAPANLVKLDPEAWNAGPLLTIS